MKINIDNVLKTQNKSMYWLSKETGIAYPSIHNIVKGKTQKIEFSTMEKISKVLDVSLDEIFKVE